MQNDIMLRVLRREKVERPPVWIMRQAGRYLPEYRELRAKTPDFLSFVKNPKLTVQALLQPLQRFDLDAAILFSDILVLPSAMGADLSFNAGEGPVFTNPVTTLQDVDALQIPDIEQQMDYVLQAVADSKHALADKVPLIGFAGAPWTVACYMLQGRGGNNFMRARQKTYQNSKLVSALIEKLTIATVEYLSAQVKAGADVIMLFDSWAAFCPAEFFEQFVVKPLHAITLALKTSFPELPVMVFAKGCAQHAALLNKIAANAYGVDWSCSLQQARALFDGAAIQGNFDPMLLFAEADVIRKIVHSAAEQLSNLQNWIVNLGHGIDKDTPIAGVEAFLQAVKEIKR